MISVVALINAVIVIFYIIGVLFLFVHLYASISTNNVYPYSKSPLIYSLLLSIFICPGAFVFMQLLETDCDSDNYLFVPKIKFKREKIQIIDVEHIHSLWYDIPGSNIGNSIATSLRIKFRNIINKKV